MAILVGLIVFVLKLIAYFLSNSVALLSDALESTINIVASIMMFYALNLASQPEDEDHRYGHQKAENISALVEGILIIIAAILIIEAAVGRLSDPIPLEDINLGLIISLGATSLNGILAWAMMKEARKSRSMALEGDAKHLFSDVVSSAGVVVGLIIAVLTGLYVLDSVIAMVVAVLLIRMGVEVLRKTTRDLMDATCEEEELVIVGVLEKNQDLLEYHDLRTRRSGTTVFMDVHICIDGKKTVSEGQGIVAKVEEELKVVVPGIVPNFRIEDETQCKRYKAEGKN
ncbi:MAG: cation transporter [Methanomassiliicoccus sp.]|nr:cation transporter [Methanomassiliicoccus sp.]